MKAANISTKLVFAAAMLLPPAWPMRRMPCASQAMARALVRQLPCR